MTNLITELSNDKYELRAQVEQLTSKFLAMGGRIQVMPVGRRNETKSLDAPEDN